MKLPRLGWLQKFRRLWETPTPEPGLHAARIYKVQRGVVMPAKLVLVAVAVYYIFFSNWVAEKIYTEDDVLGTLQNLQRLMAVYALFTAGIAAGLVVVSRFPLRMMRWVVLLIGLVDGVFLAAMASITGGFESTLYWAFPILIVTNALSLPLGAPQIMLNLSLSAFYMGAGILNADRILNAETSRPNPQQISARSRAHKNNLNELTMQKFLLNRDPRGSEVSPEKFLLRLIVLWLFTVCCYGVQVLGARQKQVEEEAREFAARQGQLRTAGRLAAEIAHQIKNPLAIINNTTFSMRRALAGGRTDVTAQLAIIQEEVERSDRIITQLMGYARLAEGRVEKIEVEPEIERAIDEVFPPAVGYEIAVQREYDADLPPLLMQRGHLSAVLVNLLQNAREALDGRGRIRVAAHKRDLGVEVSIQDNGPGIAPDQVERVFEAYFTTKEKGTGLGLAIVKHNVDLYGGRIRIESELGKGCRFVVTFPAKTLVLAQKEI